jgi:hypothetical protein
MLPFKESSVFLKFLTVKKIISFDLNHRWLQTLLKKVAFYYPRGARPHKMGARPHGDGCSSTGMGARPH